MGLVRTVLTTPILVAPVVAAVMWRFMYQPDFGILNTVLTPVGLPTVGWLSTRASRSSRSPLIDVWQWTPFVFLILLSGMYGIPRQLLRGGRARRHGHVRQTLFITIPLLKRVLIDRAAAAR